LNFVEAPVTLKTMMIMTRLWLWLQLFWVSNVSSVPKSQRLQAKTTITSTT